MLRSLTLMLTLASTAAVAPAATHRFEPGHGLTLRTTDKLSPTKDDGTPNPNYIAPADRAQRLIDECKRVGVWMKIIEIEYDWGTLENDLPTGVNEDHPSLNQRDWNYGGLNQIRNDAKLCAANDMYLRVMLTTKYADFPDYMTENSRHTVLVEDNPPPNEIPPRNIKLEQDSPAGKDTLGLLEDLYKKVIYHLQQDEVAMEGFYGFVIQETAIGNTDYYDDINDPNAVQRKKNWYVNLRKFHDTLGGPGYLLDFDPVAPRGRLFWQMVNSPYGEVNTTIIELPDGAGLCGPDTFPRESSAFNKTTGLPADSALYKTYDNHMRKNSARPVSLHVYHNNYRYAKAHFLSGANDTKGVQPIWASTTLNALNGTDNLNAGDGIANFLGCVTTADNGSKPNDLDVHNVIWSWISGTLTPYNGDNDPNKDGLQLSENEAGPDQPTGPFGWAEVSDWMMGNGPSGSADQFPRWGAGGCRTAVPSLIIQ